MGTGSEADKEDHVLYHFVCLASTDWWLLEVSCPWGQMRGLVGLSSNWGKFIFYGIAEERPERKIVLSRTKMSYLASVHCLLPLVALSR